MGVALASKFASAVHAYIHTNIDTHAHFLETILRSQGLKKTYHDWTKNSIHQV